VIVLDASPIPAQYLKPFPGVMDVREVSLDEMQRVCAGSIDLKPGDFIFACSIHDRNRLACIIYLPPISEVTAADRARLQQIELANCNGWHD